MNAPLPLKRIPPKGVPLPAPHRIGGIMQRISLSWFAELGAFLKPVADSNSFGANTTLTVFELYRLRPYLALLADVTGYPLDLKVSRPVISQLLWRIDNIVNEKDQDAQKQKFESDRWNIWMEASRLETLLSGELAVQPVYHLWPIRAYNTETLVANGERVFSEDARKEFNAEEIYNLKEAGKCLAFQVPTAAAFHMFRCVESLIRRYYETVVGKLPKPKMRNWGVYIKALRACNADPKVMVILEQIKDLHRNPVIHPEEKLNNEEALSLLGIMDSAVTAIVSDMKVRREKTSPSLPLSNPPQPDLSVFGVLSAQPEKFS